MTTRMLRLFAATLGLSTLVQLPAAAQSGYTFQTMAMPSSGYPAQIRNNLTFVGGNYIWTPGSGYTYYNYPGATTTQLVGLNDSGYVLGRAYPTTNPNNYQPFLLYGGSTTNASAAGYGLTNGMLTVSYSSSNTASYGYINQVNSSALTTFAIPSTPPNYGTAFGINDTGQVVGQYQDSSGNNTNYIRNTDGSFTTFPNQYGSAGYLNATGIANGPLVVGAFSNNATGTNFGFVRSPDGSIATFQVPNGSITRVPLITNSGVVLGGATTPDGGTTFLFFAYPPGYTGPKAF